MVVSVRAYSHGAVPRHVLTASSMALVLVAALHTCAMANEGFTEPYRTVNVAAPEAGIVQEVPVQEGAVVKQGQPLVRLDIDVHKAQLAMAEAGKEARGRVDAAQAEVDVRSQRLEALQKLRESGHARQEEVERARADLAIAHGQLTAAQEQQRLKHLEYDKIQVQISRRTVRAPLDGVVTEIFKQPGEFTAPNDPNLLTVVQLDPLAATFDVSAADAERFSVGGQARVELFESNTTVDATVEYVSPVLDAESGTIAVKVRIANAQGELQGGQACTLHPGKGSGLLKNLLQTALPSATADTEIIPTEELSSPALPDDSHNDSHIPYTEL